MSELTIRLFGALALERDGQPLERPPSGRVKDLLLYLVLQPDALHAREQLAGLFWGDLEAEKARHCLNTTLWRLQRLLGPAAGAPYLRVTAQHLGFSLAGEVRVDTAEFERCCDFADRLGSAGGAQQAAWCRQALALYRGDLVPECYDDWCVAERERLQGRCLRVLGQLQAYHTARGESAAAIACAQRVLAADPLREDARRGLIKLYLAAGQPAAALATYRHGEGIVRRELGADLLPETRALLGVILRAQAGPSASAAGDPREALARLREATASFDRASAQLRRAVALLEAIFQPTAEEAGAVTTASALGRRSTGKPPRLTPEDDAQLLSGQLVDAAAALVPIGARSHRGW